jgi:hypothetical protein
MRSSWLLLARSRIWLDCLSNLRSDAAAFSLAQSVARPLLAPNFFIDSGDDVGLMADSLLESNFSSVVISFLSQRGLRRYRTQGYR